MTLVQAGYTFHLLVTITWVTPEATIIETENITDITLLLQNKKGTTIVVLPSSFVGLL